MRAGGRAGARGRAEATTHFDDRQLEFHTAVADGYREFAERYAPSRRHVDAGRAKDAVFEDVMGHLLSLV
jgi:thymidylate kinase